MNCVTLKISESLSSVLPLSWPWLFNHKKFSSQSFWKKWKRSENVSSHALLQFSFVWLASCTPHNWGDVLIVKVIFWPWGVPLGGGPPPPLPPWPPAPPPPPPPLPLPRPAPCMVPPLSPVLPRLAPTEPGVPGLVGVRCIQPFTGISVLTGKVISGGRGLSGWLGWRWFAETRWWRGTLGGWSCIKFTQISFRWFSKNPSMECPFPSNILPFFWKILWDTKLFWPGVFKLFWPGVFRRAGVDRSNNVSRCLPSTSENALVAPDPQTFSNSFSLSSQSLSQ